ncbi:MAG: hypothetical protein AAF487_13675, partial [Bacteroidota bacterium]
MGTIEEIFYTTDIWKHFEKVAQEEEKITLIKDLVSHGIPILDRIIETFPTYTIHSGQHQLNILNLYSSLLGERIKELNDLETAILILSAFYHDIGMVFKKDEKNNLAKEEMFTSFLNENPSAKLQYYTEDKVSEELGEWYCRWAHAKRVWVYLNELNEKLIWDGNNIRKELANVCLSHNEDTEFIKSSEIPSDYWGNADLKFCSIILRLADILDFDRSRSPLSVYRYLGLHKASSSSSKQSQKEWLKHLATKGFDFGEWSNEIPYEIGFKASPTNP